MLKIKSLSDLFEEHDQPYRQALEEGASQKELIELRREANGRIEKERQALPKLQLVA
jgi:hypothetical protein